MAPLYVTEFRLPSSPRSEDETPKERIFTWRDGGTIAKHEGKRFTTAVKFQYNPAHKGWDLLSIAW